MLPDIQPVSLKEPQGPIFREINLS